MRTGEARRGLPLALPRPQLQALLLLLLLLLLLVVVGTPASAARVLIAGGEFTSAGSSSSAACIACWDAAARDWTALGAGVNGNVVALATFRGDLVA